MMPTLCALRRMLSSDIKPLKAGLQEKTQSSLILCVTWHLFGAAFLLHRVWRGIQIGKHRQESTKSKWWCEEDPPAVIHLHTWSTGCIELCSILAFRLGQILMRGKSEGLVNQLHWLWCACPEEWGFNVGLWSPYFPVCSGCRSFTMLASPIAPDSDSIRHLQRRIISKQRTVPALHWNSSGVAVSHLKCSLMRSTKSNHLLLLLKCLEATGN